MKFLRKPQVREITGLSNTSIDRLERADQFPRRVRLGANSVAWIESEVTAWQEERVFLRETEAA